MIIKISKALRTVLYEYSENSLIEVGFALLSDKKDEITKIANITNTSDSSGIFTSDVNQLLQIDQYCKENEYKVIGFFHSHINYTAYPSARDVGIMKEGNQIWLIYSKLNKNMFAYEFKDKLKSIYIIYT